MIGRRRQRSKISNPIKLDAQLIPDWLSGCNRSETNHLGRHVVAGSDYTSSGARQSDQRGARTSQRGEIKRARWTSMSDEIATFHRSENCVHSPETRPKSRASSKIGGRLGRLYCL
jgi:hypothetical protein